MSILDVGDTCWWVWRHLRDFESKRWKINRDRDLKDIFRNSSFGKAWEIELAFQWRWFQIIWSYIEGVMIYLLKAYQPCSDQSCSDFIKSLGHHASPPSDVRSDQDGALQIMKSWEFRSDQLVAGIPSRYRRKDPTFYGSTHWVDPTSFLNSYKYLLNLIFSAYLIFLSRFCLIL